MHKKPLNPFGYTHVLPAWTWGTKAHEENQILVDLKSLGILPEVAGGAPSHGYHQADDIVTQLADGTPLTQVWDDMLALLNAVNTPRQTWLDFLTFGVTNPVETITNPGQGVDFELSSEFGLPTSSRLVPSYYQMGYTFNWYDLGARFTWRFLADATQGQVDSVANAAVEAYYRLRLAEVMKTIFNNSNLSATIRGNAYPVYKFYNNDGTVPPAYKSNTFTSTHNHYVASGANTVDAGDLKEILDDFTLHGYSVDRGYTIVIVVNKQEGDVIRGFKSAANGGAGTYDFIPSQGQPGQIFNQTTILIGATQVPATYKGMNVIGSYGNALIVQDEWEPAGYLFGFATGGVESFGNPVGLREHANTDLRGLKLVKGRTPDYPLMDSYWTTGFGTGIRHRGAGYVMKITSGSYTVPTQYQ